MKNFFPVLVCLFLAACQPQVKPAIDIGNVQRQIEREAELKKQVEWSFRGRIAVSDGQQAGTVKLRWQQRAEQFDIEISLPITNQKYRLRSIGKGVRLEGFGLVMLEGESAEAVLQQATGWLMQNALANPDNAGAGATDYMKLLGLVTFGYMWARMVKVAQDKIAAGAATPYLNTKLVTGRFFMEDRKSVV